MTTLGAHGGPVLGFSQGSVPAVPAPRESGTAGLLALLLWFPNPWAFCFQPCAVRVPGACGEACPQVWRGRDEGLPPQEGWVWGLWLPVTLSDSGVPAP